MDAAGVDQGASEADWNVLYAGYQWDGAVTQMFHVRNRCLIPYIGTWNRRDPIGYQDGMNLTEYVDNVPVSFLDPLGLQRMYGSLPSGINMKLRPNNRFRKIRDAAAVKGLPTRMFNQILAKYSGNKAPQVSGASSPYYRDVYDANTIYIRYGQFNSQPSKWSAADWANFYNELFHAWYDIVGEEDPEFHGDYQASLRSI